MKLYEHEGKALFKAFGIPVPEGQLATSVEEVTSAARTFNRPVMLKAQVLSGGRGKAGGVVRVDDEEQAKSEASRLFGRTIHGLPVETFLVEEQLPHDQELYMSYYLDSATERLWFLFSPFGGVDVESIETGRVLRLPVAVRQGLDKSALCTFLSAHGLKGASSEIAELATALFRCVRERDLLLAEINPLFLTDTNRLIAADARVEIDDNALFRSDEYGDETRRLCGKSDPERHAALLGLNGFVTLDGEIGILASGAGLGMATMDLLHDVGLRPANFLETGGSISAKLVRGALELVLDQQGLRGVLVNLYGGINPMVAAARGLVEAVEARRPEMPIVVKVFGNEQEQAWALLEGAGIPTVRDIETEKAVERLNELLEVSA